MYREKYIKYKNKYINSKNSNSQAGGFVGSVLGAAKGVWKIKIKVNEFRLIAETIQEIVRDSFKPNGLYDIATICSAMSNPVYKNKILKIIEKKNLPLGELDQLTFLKTANELKKELENLRKISNNVASYLGGQKIKTKQDIIESLNFAEEIAITDIEDVEKEASSDIKKKKNMFKKIWSSIKKKKRKLTTKKSAVLNKFENEFDNDSKTKKFIKMVRVFTIVDTWDRELDRALKTFNIAVQQFQVEYLFHSLTQLNIEDIKVELVNHDLFLLSSYTKCKNETNSDFGTPEFIKCYEESIKKDYINKAKMKMTLNQQIKIILKEIPDIIDEGLRKVSAPIDFSFVETVEGAL